MSRAAASDDDSARPTPGATRLRATSVLPWRDAGWRSPLDVLALATVAASFWLVAGVPGLLAAGALAVTWLFVPPVAVFAAGTVAVTALLPSGSSLEVAVVPVAPLAVLLLATPAGGARFRRALVLVGAGAVLAGVVALVMVFADATWLAGVALLTAAALWYVSVDLMTLSHVGSTDE